MYRIALLIGLIIIVPLGYFVRFAQISGLALFSDVFGSIAYEIFWTLFVAFLYPKVSPEKAAFGVFLATCALEFLQLWQHPILVAARATLPGRLVFGNTFIWWDFIAYIPGGLISWFVLRTLKIKYGKPSINKG